MNYRTKLHSVTRWMFSGRRRWILALAAGLALVAILNESRHWQVLPSDLPVEVELLNPAFAAASEPARRAATTFLANNRVAGLALCMATTDSLGWCLAAGYADLDAGTPLRSDQALRLGSVSKPITATLLGRLLDRGALRLEDPVSRWLSVPEQHKPLTLEQLASHTAGIRHYRWSLSWPPHETLNRTHYESIADSLVLFARDPLLFEPGTDFTYSSYGYSLLGAALEQAGDNSFAELVRTEFAVDAGLATVSLDDVTATNGAVSFYQPVGGWARDALISDTSRSWPGAGLVASAEDLARFGGAFVAGDLVTPETMEQMLTERRLPGDRPNPQGYGLGWRVARTERFLGGGKTYRIAHHGGVSSGASAFLLVFPDEGVAFAALSNTGIGSGPLAQLTFAVAEPFVALVDGLSSSGER